MTGATDPADLDVADAVQLLRDRRLSATELTEACLGRIRDRDGWHSANGDPTSINAWVRTYDEAAVAAAVAADRRLSAAGVAADGPPPPLCGVPVGLKDLYAVAGRPLTASSRVLDEVPAEDCDAWWRLAAAGAVLLGHTHTHEFAAGGTTDQVGNPWALDRAAGGSSGGSAAALAAGMVPAAMGTDTAGSLRIPSALCGTSTIKPTRGLVSTAGVVPLAPSLDHCGPMARTVADCALLLAAVAGPDRGDATSAFAGFGPAEPAGAALSGVRFAFSPRIADRAMDDEVRVAFFAAANLLIELGAILVEPTVAAPEEHSMQHFRVLWSEMPVYHERFADRRADYRPATRELLEMGERAALTAADYVGLQAERRAATAAWTGWLDDGEIDLLVEPTVPVLAAPRGTGYEHLGTDADLISLAYLWCWTGFPVVGLPAGLGARSGLPVGISLVARAGDDARLLRAGTALQTVIGVPRPPVADLP